MTPEQAVKAVYPGSRLWRAGPAPIRYIVRDSDEETIGGGETPEEAWRDAEMRLKQNRRRADGVAAGETREADR